MIADKRLVQTLDVPPAEALLPQESFEVLSPTLAVGSSPLLVQGVPKIDVHIVADCIEIDQHNLSPLPTINQNEFLFLYLSIFIRQLLTPPSQ
jgi:hypothetical protein